ncbi:hypothetical protein LP415_13430 [Polaromonas sp. P1(28)-8]|nr:hypothetical protein LP415_13430 [Polaromonas sp. P1(28)-8]
MKRLACASGLSFESSTFWSRDFGPCGPHNANLAITVTAGAMQAIITASDAAIPSAIYGNGFGQRGALLLCEKDDTLHAALERLAKL